MDSFASASVAFLHGFGRSPLVRSHTGAASGASFHAARRKRSRVSHSKRTRMSGAAPIPESPDCDLTLCSPSKINLFLRVLSKREDGFHELASLFQAITLHDELSFFLLPEGATEDELECSTPGIPTGPSNLVLRALDTFRKRTGKTQYFRVRLEKRVPAQAGLGGGSANAATALWGANQLCGKPATVEELADYGAEFGSDVSFFFSMGTAYCTGRGEKLRNLDRLQPQTLWIIKPNEGLSTGAVFGALDLSKTSQRDPEDLLRIMENEMLESSSCDAFVNDLEAPSFQLEPRLGIIKAELEICGFNQVLMSGSGTSFFCIGEPDADHYGDKFVEQFSAEYNCQILRAMFTWRKHPDYWYMQRPTDEELLEWRSRRDAGKSPKEMSAWPA